MIQSNTIRACTIDAGNIRTEIGGSTDLARYVQDKHIHVYIVADDDDMVEGYRVLAEGWYDASEPQETPEKFASRLFGLANALA